MNFKKPLEPFIITSNYGWRIHPITNVRTFHNGIDLKGFKGQPIYNISPGVVKSTYFNPIGGKQVIIQHDNGYLSGYAHLDTIKVLQGQRLNRADIIGSVGDSGRVTGAHLHFTLKDQDGTRVNPGKESLYKLGIDFLEFLIFPAILFIIHQFTKK